MWMPGKTPEIPLFSHELALLIVQLQHLHHASTYANVG